MEEKLTKMKSHTNIKDIYNKPILVRQPQFVYTNQFQSTQRRAKSVSVCVDILLLHVSS